jgi:hypothetical protein
MKVEYKNILGQLNENSDNCDDCCFYNLTRCIPYYLHQCYDHVFEGVKTQIFDL